MDLETGGGEAEKGKGIEVTLKAQWGFSPSPFPLNTGQRGDGLLAAGHM